MRSTVARLGKDPQLIEPLVPVDLVVDHSVQVDYWSSTDAFRLNMEIEFKRNQTRYQRVAHIRTGLVLSSAGGALPKMLPAFKLGLAATLGDGQQWVPWIHLDDIVGIFLHALLTDTVVGPINAAAPNIVRNDEFTCELADILNRPSFLAAPSFALNLVLGEMAELVLMSDRVTPSRALETGYHFRYTHLKKALKSLLK